MPVRQLVSRLSPRGWAVVGGSAAVAVLFLFIVFRMASAPSYSTILTGLNPAQTGKITSTLDTKGIGYQIQNGGTALAVTSSQTSQARVALATAGLLGSQQPGMSLFDSQQLGASSFQQQVTYQRALEGQLTQTIESIQGVSSAQVQLVLPNATQQLFADSSTPATAAVELSGSTSLDPGAVKGIAALVASSVQGLSAAKVTITDGSGNLLWPTADSGGTSSGSLLAKESAQQQYDQSQAAQLQAMLAQTLGPGKAQVMVNADLNADQATQNSLVYAKKGIPLTQQTQNETLTGAGATSAAGAAGTIPAYANTGGGAKSKYANKSANTTYGVDKTVTSTTIAPGKINHQSVSVLISKSVPASAIPALRAAVASAAGLVPSRGDTLSFGQVAFANTTAPTVSTPSKMLDYAKYGGVALAALGFLLFAIRQLRRREHEALTGQPTWLRELESPLPLAALERSSYADEEEPAQVRQLRAPVNVARRQVEDLVERDPDRVAQQVRAWMAED
jgi:flagellar M-ring protein FliF